jgi:hypothetical protein
VTDVTDGPGRFGDNSFMPAEETMGAGFVAALAAKDSEAIVAMLDPQIDFRALTPRRSWEASDPGQVLETLFGNWFEPSDQILEVLKVETDTVAQRERVGYRLAVRNPEGSFVVEQQAYLSGSGGRIAWMRVLCSGYQPLE